MTSCILDILAAGDGASGSSMGLGFLLMASHLPHISVDMQQMCGVTTVCIIHKGCTT